MPNMDPKKCPMPVQDPEVRNKKLFRGGFGLYARDGGKRGQALPALQKQAVCVRLPGWH